MKIGFVCRTALAQGCGVGDHGLRLARALAGQSTVVLACRASFERPWPSEVDRSGSLLVPEPWNARLRSRVVRWIDQEGIDLLILEYAPHLGCPSGLDRSALHVALAARSRGCPLIVFFHEFAEPWQWKARRMVVGSHQRLIGTMLMALCRGAVVPSYERVEALERFSLAGEPRVRLIPSGSTIERIDGATAEERLSMRQSLGIGVDSTILALFGSDHWSRQASLAVAALRGLLDAGIDAHLVVLGRAGRLVQDEVERGAGLPPARVHRLGFRPEEEVSRWLETTDLFLAPFTDGVSTRRTSLLTAFEHGRAVVGTAGVNTDRRSFDPSFIRLVAAGDAVRFSQEVLNLARDRKSRDRLGATAREVFLEHFSWDRIANQVLEVVRDVLPREGASRTRRRYPMISTSSERTKENPEGRSRSRSTGDRERFLLLAPLYPPSTGGIQRYLLGLATALGPEGTLVLAPGKSDPKCSGPVPVRRVRGTFRGLWPLAWGLSIARWARRFRATVLIVGHLRLAPVAHVVARILGIPYVVLAYGMEMTAGRFAGLKRSIWRRADRIVTISRFSAELLYEAGAPPERVEILAPGLEERWLEDPEENGKLRGQLRIGDGPVLLTVGRLDSNERYKGHDQVLTVLRPLRERFPGIRYLVVGDGDDRSRLEAEAVRLGVSDSVLFLGRVPEEMLAQHYRLADVFVMPGREIEDRFGRKFEGFGIVFLEAAAMERPAIAGRAGGAPDAVVDGETGYVVDPDDRDELEERLVTLLSDPRIARRMGDAGRRRVEKNYLWSRLPVREALSFSGERRGS